MNPQRRREKVYVGCGAGFGGDRPLAALKLLQRVKELNYLVLECLAERTLSDLYQAMKFGGDGFDPRSMCFCSCLINALSLCWLLIYTLVCSYSENAMG